MTEPTTELKPKLIKNKAERLSIDEIHEACMTLLEEFDALCRSNGLRYDIVGGTLLGAVRHRGFIPWDDDADVSMPRPDYERLLDLCPDFGAKLQPRRRIVSLRDKSFPRHYARYVRTDLLRDARFASDEDCPYFGIDIFPHDGISEDTTEFLRQIKRIERLRRLLLISTSRKGSSSRGKSVALAKDLVRPLLKLYGSYRIASRLNAECSRVPFETAKYVGGIAGMYGLKERWSKEQMLPQTEFDFGRLRLLGYKNYDIYLSNLYGEYMTLPPKDKRVPHFDSFYWA
ncbi:phosphorylcholine transferase LicD [Olsenella sp. DNF00959]|uniref:LicD family protein n=1 Tax=Olsenella sp. DNF00959 TaxID=1476999 RepID=UPI000785F299|nr:LicD family protein [Olsenella sp. DNF00959]